MTFISSKASNNNNNNNKQEEEEEFTEQLEFSMYDCLV